MSDYALLQAVIVEPRGSTLASDAALSATQLSVDSAQDFDNDGGTLDLNGARLQYTSIIEGTNPDDPDTINLASPLLVAATTDDAVGVVIGGLIPEDWYAVVSMGSEGEDAHIPLDVDQRAQWPVGEYPDPVPVIVSDDLQHLEDAPGRTVSSRNAFCNTDTYTYDGVAASIKVPLSKLPISGSEQPYWKKSSTAVGGLAVPPGKWRVEVPNLVIDDAGLMTSFGSGDLFWVDYAWDSALADIQRPPAKLPYVDEVLADSPYLYWRLGDSSGTTAADSSGNARDGTYSGSPTLGAASLLASDGSNTAVAFDGVNDYISYADTADLTNFSVECWFESPPGFQPVRPLIHRFNSSLGRLFNLSIPSSGGSGSVAFQVETSVSSPVLTTYPLVYNDGNPHHVVATYDGAQIRLYVDGTLITSTPLTGVLDTSNSPFEVGARSASGQFYSGIIDEVAYYTTALSAARVLAHYNAGR